MYEKKEVVNKENKKLTFIKKVAHGIFVNNWMLKVFSIIAAFLFWLLLGSII